ncbi:MAG: hypothetical protein NVS3B25_01250 [Hymenobacter sp.]
MKKALLILLAGLFTAVAPALAYPSPAANVNFSSEHGVPFGLVLDGRPLTRGLARQVHVDQLRPGLHWADFTLPTAYSGPLHFRSRVWLEPGLETSFVLIARPGWPLDLQEVAAAPLYGPNYGSRRGSECHDHDYDERHHDRHGYGSHGSYDNYGYDNYGYDGNDYAAAPNRPTGGYDGDGGPGYYPGSATSSYRTLPPQEVDALVQGMQQRPFEASKLSSAKEALGQRSIQADDLRRLLQTLDVEASRVELAEFAYPHVADPQNFDRVYEAFDSETSAREVQQTVAAAPPR